MRLIVDIPEESIKNTYYGNMDVIISFLDGFVNDVYCDENVEHFDYKVIPDNVTNWDVIKTLFPNIDFTASAV